MRVATSHGERRTIRCRSIALDNLRKTLPPTDEDQRLAVFHAPFKGTTLFGGELAKLQEANTKHAVTFTVFPITKPGQSKEDLTTMTVSVPQDSNKLKVEPRDDTSQSPRKK